MCVEMCLCLDISVSENQFVWILVCYLQCVWVSVYVSISVCGDHCVCVSVRVSMCGGLSVR